VLSDDTRRKEYDEMRALFGSGAFRPGGGGRGAGYGAGPGFSGVNLRRPLRGCGGGGLGDMLGGLFGGSAGSRPGARSSQRDAARTSRPR
jgi:molecular chaperone DnaJ